MAKLPDFFLEIGMWITEGEVKELLHCKQDKVRRKGPKPTKGEKDEEPTVVKYNVQQAYGMTVCVQPGKDIKHMCIGGQRLEMKSLKERYTGDETRKYTSQWSTAGYDISKDGDRKRIGIEVEFTTGEFLKTEIYGKFYPAEDRERSRDGKVLGTISLVCNVPEGPSVNVRKMLFM